MCGISGIISDYSNLENSTSIVKKMIDKIHYRGPDDENICNCNNRAIFGHKRLKIVDFDNGIQPFFSKCNRYVLVYNGEIYNYDELKNYLKSFNIYLKSRSDTELLIELLILKKQNILNKINGMFSFFFYDSNTKEWIAARDHFGIKPFYYSILSNKFYFSSEIKSLLSINALNKSINRNALSEYLTFQYTLDEKTLHKNIYKIKPAHVLLGKNSKILKNYKYWNPNFKLKSYKNEKNYNNDLRFLIKDSIKLRKRSDVKISSYLSGGIDSTLVSSLLNDKSEKLNVFHGYFDEGSSFSELNYATIAAKKLNLKLNKIKITSKDFINNIEKIIYYLDEPCAGPGVFPQYIVSKFAKKNNFKVIFGGQGGDEIFGGYARYQIAYLEQSLKGAIYGNNESKQHIVSLNSITDHLYNLKSYTEMISNFWSQNLFGDMEARYFSLINRMNNFESILSKEFTNQFSKEKIYEKFKYNFNNSAKSYIKKMTNFDLNYSLPSLLQVEDRVSMSCSIESRCPFLDFRIIDLVNQIPPRYQYKDGINKSFLINTFKNNIPLEIKNRNDKMGFPVPLNIWLKDKKFKSFFMDKIFTKKLKETGIFNYKNLEQNLDLTNYTNARMLWGILSLSIWIENSY